MTRYNEALHSFSSLLHWHLTNGTRPPGAKRAGKPWDNKEFGGAVGRTFDEKSVRNWLVGRHLPRALDHIERALFGDELKGEYATWADDLRTAYVAQKQAQKPAPEAPASPLDPVDASECADEEPSPAETSATLHPAATIPGAPARPPGAALRTFDAHPGGVFAAIVSPDNTNIASVGLSSRRYDNRALEIKIRDIESGLVLHQATSSLDENDHFHHLYLDNILLAHGIFPNINLGYSTNGRRLFFCDKDLVNPQDVVGDASLQRHFSIGFTDGNRYSPDGSLLLLNTGKIINSHSEFHRRFDSNHQIIRSWHLDGNPTFCNPFSTSIFWPVCFSPDVRRLVGLDSSGKEAAIRMWDIKTGGRLRKLSSSESVFCRSITFSRDGTRIVALIVRPENQIKIWDAESGDLLRTLRSQSGWRVRTENAVTYRRQKGMIIAMALAPDGSQIALGDKSGCVEVWEIEGDVLRQFGQGHTGAVLSVAYSPDGSRLLTGGIDGTLRVWLADPDQ
jgi:WD40 repeat protein